MNTRWLWSGMLLGSTLLFGGCGSGQYQIPPVEPVVKQKPQDDLLESIAGGGDEKPAETSPPSSAPPAGSSDAPSGGSGDSAKPAEGAKPAPKK